MKLLEAVAATATNDSTDQVASNTPIGLLLCVSVTAIGTDSITPSIQARIGGIYKTIWTAAAALVANGDNLYMICPRALDAISYKEKVLGQLPRNWRLRMVANN